MPIIHASIWSNASTKATNKYTKVINWYTKEPAFILKNIFLSSTGALVGKAGANITQRSVTKIEMV